MDEFKGNADGEKYQLAIYDNNKTLVTVLKNRKSNTIRDFFFTLDIKPKVIEKTYSVTYCIMFRDNF